MAKTPAPDAAESELDRGPTHAAPVEPRGQVPLAAATAHGSRADRYVAECAVFGVADAITDRFLRPRVDTPNHLQSAASMSVRTATSSLR